MYPEISVIIPCYNAETFIGETIESVLGQSYKAVEVIVVNDGSTDGTQYVIEKFLPHIKIIKQTNQGECCARNTGLNAARAPWVAFLDADDLWLPYKLSVQAEIIRKYGNEDLVCVHSGYYLLLPDRSKKKSTRATLRQAFVNIRF